MTSVRSISYTADGVAIIEKVGPDGQITYLHIRPINPISVTVCSVAFLLFLVFMWFYISPVVRGEFVTGTATRTRYRLYHIDADTEAQSSDRASDEKSTDRGYGWFAWFKRAWKTKLGLTPRQNEKLASYYRNQQSNDVRNRRGKYNSLASSFQGKNSPSRLPLSVVTPNANTSPFYYTSEKRDSRSSWSPTTPRSPSSISSPPPAYVNFTPNRSENRTRISLSPPPPRASVASSRSSLSPLDAYYVSPPRFSGRRHSSIMTRSVPQSYGTPIRPRSNTYSVLSTRVLSNSREGSASHSVNSRRASAGSGCPSMDFSDPFSDPMQVSPRRSVSEGNAMQRTSIPSALTRPQGLQRATTSLMIRDIYTSGRIVRAENDPFSGINREPVTSSAGLEEGKNVIGISRKGTNTGEQFDSA